MDVHAWVRACECWRRTGVLYGKIRVQGHCLGKDTSAVLPVIRPGFMVNVDELIPAATHVLWETRTFPVEIRKYFANLKDNQEGD